MRIAWTVVVVAALGCACGKGSVRATVSTRAAAVTAAPAQGGTIVLNRLQMVVERVRLEGTDPAQMSSSGTQVEVENEVGDGPFLLDLDGSELGGPVSHAFDITVPPGDYHELRFRVRPTDSHQTSITIDGTFNGTAFTFTSSLDEDQRKEGAFTIGGTGTSNITLSLDTSMWFSDGAGGTLDPAVDANRSLIESNIKASLVTFEDDDLDGHDDTTQHH